MFADTRWASSPTQNLRYLNWKTAVMNILKENKNKKMVVLEIGCGQTVPTVRMQAESFLKSVPNDQCTLIRINPEDPPLTTIRTIADNVISIDSRGVTVLQTIDRYIRELEQKR